MDHYIDVVLNPDAEMRENVLMNMAYAKLHKALFSLKSDFIGVSFPEYNVKLGRCLRVHGTKSSLSDLQGLDWLGAMKGYCTVSAITAVPTDVQYRAVSRKQPAMSIAKLNRLIKRGSISKDEISPYKAKMFAGGIHNPYVELVSGSTGHRHRRFIEFGPLMANPVAGTFDTFGLSKVATIPWF